MCGLNVAHRYKKYMEMPVLCAALTLFACLWTVGVTPGHAATTLDSYSPTASGQHFRILAVSGSHLLAATELRLFRLTPDLKEEESRLFTSTSRLLVASNLQPSTTALSRTFRDSLLLCGSDCFLLNATQFTNIFWSISLLTADTVVDGGITKAIGVLQEKTEAELVLTYAQNDYIDGIGTTTSSVASRIVRGVIIGAGTDSQNGFSTVASQIEQDPLQGREFLHTFTRNGFTYFVFVMTLASGLNARVSRVCDSDVGSNNSFNFSSYIELELLCGDTNGDPTSATFVPLPNAFEVDTIILSVRITRLSEIRNRMCAFNLTLIDKMMVQKYDNCTRGIGMMGLARDSQIPCQPLPVSFQ